MAKTRPVIVIAADVATELVERGVVVPISPRQGSGLERSSFATACLPTTVLRQHLKGPIGRCDAEVDVGLRPRQRCVGEGAWGRRQVGLGQPRSVGGAICQCCILTGFG